MAVLVWLMVGIALWHFTIFLPDRFWGGIVGAFLGACAGAVVFGVLTSGLSIPGRDDTEIVHAFQAVPGALIGIALVYVEGIRRERAEARYHELERA